MLHKVVENYFIFMIIEEIFHLFKRDCEKLGHFLIKYVNEIYWTIGHYTLPCTLMKLDVDLKSSYNLPFYLIVEFYKGIPTG